VPAAIGKIDVAPLEGQIDIGLVGDVYLRGDYLDQFGIQRLADLREDLWRSLEGAALVIANLEAPITDSTVPLEQKPYLHGASSAVLDAFDDRFVLSLANNHVMDFGEVGLRDTLAALDGAGIRYAGAGRNIQEASAPCIETVDELDVAIVCAADPRFHPATENRPGTCPARPERLEQVIRSITRETAVVVSLHMGLEHVVVPTGAQINLAMTYLRAGASIVHFHHAHCLSATMTHRRALVLFGAGNYVYTKRTRLASSKRTASWRVRVARDSHRIVDFGMTPAQIDDRGLPVALRDESAGSATGGSRRSARFHSPGSAITLHNGKVC
jgi:poly-gamma-glutamate synthesis protein (capsule biosynthesis protein)